MSRRPTIADVARAAHVSVATVDRVLNARHRVREPTAERVLAAAETIGFHAAPLLKSRLRPDVPERTFAFLLQRPDAFYTQLGADLADATRALTDVRGKPVVDFAPDLSSAVVAERLKRLGETAHAVAAVSVDHPRVSDAIASLRARGVPTFAILTELGAEAAAPYIGRDNRKEGRTAAWLIAKAARRPGKVGIIVGSHRFLCQETAEISFRAYLRENAPEFMPLEPFVNLEDPRIAYAATQDLIATHRDLVGLYICGGGMEGAIAGARDESAPGEIAIVCNELTPDARAGLHRRGADRRHLDPDGAAGRARALRDVGRARLAPGGGPKPRFRPLRALFADQHLVSKRLAKPRIRRGREAVPAFTGGLRPKARKNFLE